MSRFVLLSAALLALPASARADAFDNYTNPLLAQVVKSPSAEQVKQLSSEAMLQHSRALPGITAAFVVVRTNEGRLAKLLVLPARQKVGETESLPIVLVERFTTFREGEERTIQAAGQNVRLFGDFHYNLDIGQVVPAKVGGDLRFVVDGDRSYLEPVGKAELFIVTKHLPEASPKKLARPNVGEKFEARFFNGVYKIYDDGRRSGTLHLKVGEAGEVEGWYYSDKDGAKYEVGGKVGNPSHTIDFVVTLPRTIQSYRGMMFTGDGRAIAGTSRLQDRETAFYAVRVEDEKKK